MIAQTGLNQAEPLHCASLINEAEPLHRRGLFKAYAIKRLFVFTLKPCDEAFDLTVLFRIETVT